jgi:spore coat polysaccharide biosynthesis protein SpsF (cytidylyltransferase family)
MRFQLRKTADDWWCIVDNTVRYPDEPRLRLVIAHSKDYEKMNQILKLLNENAPNFQYEYDEE